VRHPQRSYQPATPMEVAAPHDPSGRRLACARDGRTPTPR
jgi:hypothetical protein